MSISKRVWILCGALVAAIVLLLLIGLSVSQRISAFEQHYRIITSALHNQAETEKVHHAIRGQVYKALLAADMGDRHKVAMVQTRFIDRRARLRHAITANAALTLPADVRAAIAQVKVPLAEYVADSTNILNSINRRQLPTRQKLDRFDEDFLRLEVRLSRISELLERRITQYIIAEDRLAALWNLVLIVGALILLAVAIAMTIMLRRGVVDPIVRVTGALRRYSAGELDVAVTDTGRDDEIGQLAKGVVTFKAAVESARLAEQRSLAADEQHRRSAAYKASEARARRRGELEQMATALEERVLATARLIHEACQIQQQAAATMSQCALTTRDEAAIATAATDRSADTAHVVVTATRQLSTAINEVSKRMIAASATTRLITERAADGRDNVLLLDQAAARIGDFSTLIANVARKTNSLAINATIEAARAGEGGRGFSVVASEVKSLAAQIGLATQQISEQIGDVRRTAGAVSCSISDMRSAVKVLDDSAASIVTAIDQQSEAIGEIDRTVHLGVEGMDGLRRIMDGVEQQVESTREISEDIATTARTLEQQGTSLVREVSDFIDRVRAA